MTKPIVIAHRGALYDCPENTLPSFQRALDLGADGIELDVQLSSDDEIVVIHDEKIDRTTESDTGSVRDFSLAQLRHMDFGGWFDRSFAGERLPTLVEVLELIKEHSGGDMNAIHLDIELKTGIVDYPGLEQKVVELLHSYDYQNVQLSSFFHWSLVEVRRLDKDMPTGVLYMTCLHEPWRYAQMLGANSLNPSVATLSPVAMETTPDYLSARGVDMKVFPWTLDEAEEMRRVLGYGVDGILTNRVAEAVAIRDELVAT